MSSWSQTRIRVGDGRADSNNRCVGWLFQGLDCGLGYFALPFFSMEDIVCYFFMDARWNIPRYLGRNSPFCEASLLPVGFGIP